MPLLALLFLVAAVVSVLLGVVLGVTGTGLLATARGRLNYKVGAWVCFALGATAQLWWLGALVFVGLAAHFVD